MFEPALTLHTSNRLEVLAERLAHDLAEDPPPPLEREIVVVQSQGMYRWLTLQLARRLGIAASLSTPFPATFCHHLAEHFLDGEGWPATEDLSRQAPSPFSRGILTWRVYALLGDRDLLDDPRWRDGPAAYLVDDPDRRKRYQLAARLAGLLDDYQLFRPQMMVGWETAPGGESEDSGSWQAMLWRRLVAATNDDHLARRCTRLIEHLRRAGTAPLSRRPTGLPRRLSVFGVSTLPPIFLRLMTALSRFLPVRIYFVSPTYHFWGDLRSRRKAAQPEDLHLEEGHPLLAALGRQGRDFFNLLQAADEDGTAWHELDFVEPESDSTLHRLQADVLHLADRGAGEPGLEPHLLDPGDDSLRIHVCHSPMREMEVVRDQILDAFARHADLRPGGVLVLVPDVTIYSPYIRAVFGVEHQGTPRLPFTIADRRAGEEQPPAGTVLQMLRLVASRLVPGDVFDLLEVAAIRRAAGFAGAEIPQLRQWIDDTRIRWGMDGEQRGEDFDLPPEEANTWRAGIDRLLMGYATGGREELVAGILPFAGATAANADLLGRLAGFISTLFDQLRALRRPRPLDVWADDLRHAVDVLYQAEDEDEERGLLLVRHVLEQLTAAHGSIADHQEEAVREVTIEVIRAHLESRLGGESAGFGFLGGGITFAALKPMRTLPFEVICVAGLDDGAFPRRDPPRSFDLMAEKPRLGDRSQRDDDRYLFLETLLAARRQLILTYVGRSQRDSSEQPPSVVVSELLDAVDRGFASPDDQPPHRHLVVEHRLQPWSPAYFERPEPPGARSRLRSYSHENYEGAVALTRGPRPEAPFVTSRAGASGTLDLGIRDLAELWVSPSRGYCRQVLKLYLDSFPVRQEDAEPFTVDSLAGYGLQNRLLNRRLRQAGTTAAGPLDGGSSGEVELELLRAAGELPLAGLGSAAFAKLDRKLRELVARLPPHRRRPPQALELAGAGWHLSGQIDDLTDLGLLRFRPAMVKSKDLIRAWILHVVWNTWSRQQSTGPRTEPLETLVVGTKKVYRFTALDEPRKLLESLIDGYRKGLERPLPLFEQASYFYADQRRLMAAPKSRLRKQPLDRARDGWRGAEYLRGDSQDPYVALCFRGQEPLESESFKTWTDYLWGPLFDDMEESSPGMIPDLPTGWALRRFET
ncbi:MAG: exodeoxyribonuclease V subunit gamma [Thermoanaerobaculia bacterium]